MKSKKDAPPRSAADVLGRLRAANAALKAAALCLAVCCAALLGVCVYLARLPKSVPWVVELSPGGEATYHPDAEKLMEDWTPNDAAQRHFISTYVQALRGVSTDNYRNKRDVSDVYNKTLERALSLLDAWYNDKNPIERAKKRSVQVPDEEVSAVRLSPDQWKVVWRETETDRASGLVAADGQYEGVFRVRFYTPATDRARRANPIGMYVVDFDIDLLRSLL